MLRRLKVNWNHSVFKTCLVLFFSPKENKLILSKPIKFITFLLERRILKTFSSLADFSFRTWQIVVGAAIPNFYSLGVGFNLHTKTHRCVCLLINVYV